MRNFCEEACFGRNEMTADFSSLNARLSLNKLGGWRIFPLLRLIFLVVFWGLPLPKLELFSAPSPVLKTGIRVDNRERYVTANAFGFGRPGTDLVVLIDESSVSPQLLDLLAQQLSMLNSRFNTALRLRVKFVSYGVQGPENPQLSMDDLTDFASMSPRTSLLVPLVSPQIGVSGVSGDLLGALEWVAGRSSWTELRWFPEVRPAVLLVASDLKNIPVASVPRIKEVLAAHDISLTTFGVEQEDSNAFALATDASGVITMDALKLAGKDNRSLLVPLFGTDPDRWTISVVSDGDSVASDFEVTELMKTAPRNLSFSTSLIRFDKQLTDFPKQWVFPVKAFFGDTFAKKDFSVFLTYHRSGVPLASAELLRYRFPRFSVYQWYLDGGARAFFPVVSAGSNIPITLLPQTATFLGFSGFPVAPSVKVTQPRSPIFSISTNIRTQTYGAGLMVNGVRQQSVLGPKNRGMIRLLSPAFTGGIGMIGLNRYAFIKKLTVTDGINFIGLDGGVDLFDYANPSAKMPSVGAGSPYQGYSFKSAY